MTIKREYGGYTFEVPETVNHRGRRYREYPSYTTHKDVAEGWVKSSNDIYRRFIIKAIKTKDGKHTLYQIYKKILNEKEEKAYHKKVRTAHDIN